MTNLVGDWLNTVVWYSPEIVKAVGVCTVVVAGFMLIKAYRHRNTHYKLHKGQHWDIIKR